MLLTIVVSVFVWMLGFLYLELDKNAQKAMFLEKQTQNQKIAWDAATKIHKVGMQSYFDARINIPSVLELASYANANNEQIRDAKRKELYSLLLPTYSELQQRNVKQLHFHDKHNNSFLRFHLPNKFGDSLNSTRPSVVLSNKMKKPVQGFETGKAVSGFRNVFPLVYKGEHIGSVELSQTFESIRSQLAELDQNKESIMVLKASEILPKIFDEQKKFYVKSGFSDNWLIEDAKGELWGGGIIGNTSKRVCLALKSEPEFKNAIEKGQPFSYETGLSDGGGSFVVTVTPIIDIEGKYSAALISFMPSLELQTIDRSFKIHLFYFTFMLFVASFALFWLLRSKKILSNERKNLAAIASTMGEGLYVIDLDGKIKYINNSALEMLGFDREAVIDKVAHYLFHVHQHAGQTGLDECPIYQTVTTGSKYNGVECFRRQNGEFFLVDAISSPLKDEDEIIGAITVFKDITERIKMEEDLRALNAELNVRVESEVAKRIQSDVLFKIIFDNSPEGILILDKDGVFVECNPVAAIMMGLKEDELIGKTPFDISPEIQPETGFFSDAAAKMFIDGAFSGNVQRFEWTHIKKDGKNVLIEVMLSKISRNNTQELLVIWRDITEIKKLQKEKEEQQAMLIQQSKLAEMGSMIGAIAHQWKQPLNTITIIIQDLVLCYEDGELTWDEMQKYKHDMVEQVSFMSQTIEDFRSFYKPSKSATTFFIAKAVNSVLSLLKNQLKNENILLSLQIDDTLRVRGFESEFQQVILNILNNAIDAFLERGIEDRELLISAFELDGKVTLRITDNAGGISEELLQDDKIFDPYSTTKGEKGTGVGLSLSKTIIEKSMGGTLKARNAGGGAEFSIELSRF